MTLPIRSPSYMIEARRIRAYYDEGHSIRPVAKHFGISCDKAMKRIREAGGSTRPRPQNGFKGRGPIKVIVLPKEPVSYRELARRHGVAPETIQRWTRLELIPSHTIQDKQIIYKDDITDLDIAAIRERTRQRRINTEPKCICCEIVLTPENSEGDICTFCKLYCKCSDGNWQWHEGWFDRYCDEIVGASATGGARR